MNREELLEEILNHYEQTEAKRIFWMKDPDNPTKGFLFVNTDDGDYIFIIKVEEGKVSLVE